MKEHPILFSTEMVKAILEGRKTQTRRVNKLEGLDGDSPYYETREGDLVPINDMCPYGQVGDGLWVRETHRFDAAYDGRPANGLKIPEGITVECKVNPHAVITDGDQHRKLTYAPGKWRPSIFMPRWASRLTLKITEIRVQRLQEISETDCLAEGCRNFDFTPQVTYRMLWDSINGEKYPWESNPFVWAISFKVVSQ